MLTCSQQHGLSITLVAEVSAKRVCRQLVSVKHGEVC